MNRIYIAILWIIMAIIFAGYVYASTFGHTEGFGTAKFGTGTTTTAVYVPGYNKKIIIGGGLVQLDKKYRNMDTIPEQNVLYDKLMLQEEREWEELLD